MDISDVIPTVSSFSRGSMGVRLTSSSWNEAIKKNNENILEALLKKYPSDSIHDSLTLAVEANNYSLVSALINEYKGFLPILWIDIDLHIRDRRMLNIMRRMLPRAFSSEPAITLRFSPTKEITDRIDKSLTDMNDDRAKDTYVDRVMRMAIRYNRVDIIQYLIGKVPYSENIDPKYRLKEFITPSWPKEIDDRKILQDDISLDGLDSTMKVYYILLSGAYNLYLKFKRQIARVIRNAPNVMSMARGNILPIVFSDPKLLKLLIDKMLSRGSYYYIYEIDNIYPVFRDILDHNQDPVVRKYLLTIAYIAQVTPILDEYMNKEDLTNIIFIAGLPKKVTKKFLIWKGFM